jgi:hypothetical protein
MLSHTLSRQFGNVPTDGRLDLIRQPSMSKAGPTLGSLAMSSPAGKDSRVRLGVWEGLGRATGGYWIASELNRL